MEGLAQLLTAVAERAFYYAVLGLVFMGLLMIGRYVGIEIPADVLKWVNVGFLFCLSLVLVEGGRRLIVFTSARIANAKALERADEEVLRNIAALFHEERQSLWALLGGDAPPRFTVGPLSMAYPLLQKGILRVVGDAGGANFICEVHPAIMKRRDSIRSALPPKTAS